MMLQVMGHQQGRRQQGKEDDLSVDRKNIVQPIQTGDAEDYGVSVDFGNQTDLCDEEYAYEEIQ